MKNDINRVILKWSQSSPFGGTALNNLFLDSVELAGPLTGLKPTLFYKQLVIKPTGKQTSRPHGLLVVDSVSAGRLSGQRCRAKGNSACQQQ